MTAASNFVHLHSHSSYSLQQGCIPVDRLIQQAADYRMDTLALTDVNNLYCAIEFYEKCLQADIRPVIGTELRKGTSSLLLFARNGKGYRFVCRAVTALQCEPEYSFRDILEQTQPEGAVIIVFSQELLEHSLEYADPDHVFTGIRPQDTVSSSYMNFIRESARSGIRAAALADAVMIDSRHEELCRVLKAIREKTTVSRITESPKFRNCSFFDRKTAQRIFADIPESLAAAREIAEQCTFEFDLSRMIFPECRVPEGETPFSHLYRICHTSLSKKYLPLTPDVSSRLARELRVIEESGFSEYFLIVREIIEYARINRIPVCTRGSGASSLVTYLLDISDVDPVKYSLRFERFLNSSRTDCPDLDIDICWRQRDEVIEHVYDTYGPHRTAMISTHNVYQPRSAFRDTALAFGVSTDRVNFLSKRINRTSLPSAAELISALPPSLSHAGDKELFERILLFSRDLQGFPRHLSIHCGGIVIAPRAITDHVPLERSAQGTVITQFEMKAIEKAGLVKIDLLGQRGLSTISETVRLAGSIRGAKLSVRDIPDRDPRTSNMLKKGKTIGCFQIESPGMRSLIQMLEVSGIKGLTDALALIRPGPASAGMKNRFIRRSRGLEPNTSPLSCLRDTHGIMLYQEDIMCAAHEAAGLPYDMGERLRKALTRGPDRKQKQRMKQYFITQAVRRGTARKTAEDVWNNIEGFAAYSFCRAHAAVYGVYAYRAAFLKAHFPAEYMTAVMNNHTGMYPRSAYIEEARRMGIPILAPDINRSLIEYSADKDGMRIGLCDVKGLSLPVMKRILGKRASRPFESPHDFLLRVRPSAPEAENLVLCGALDRWNIPRPALVWLCRSRTFAGSMFKEAVQYPDLPEYPLLKKLVYEQEVLGFTCCGHPLFFLKQERKFPSCMDLDSLSSHINEDIRAAGITIAARSCRISRNRTMGFMTIEDETGTAEVALSPDIYARYRRIIYSKGPFLVTGPVRERHGSLTIQAHRVISQLSTV